MYTKYTILISTTRLVYFGIVCDSVLCQFEVLEDNIPKLEATYQGSVRDGSHRFAMLEKVAKTCTSMALVVPAADLSVHRFTFWEHAMPV